MASEGQLLMEQPKHRGTDHGMVTVLVAEPLAVE